MGDAEPGRPEPFDRGIDPKARLGGSNAGFGADEGVEVMLLGSHASLGGL